MTWERKRWRSEWEIPPGQFILDAMNEAGLDYQQLAQALGMNADQFSALIDGDTSVTDDVAAKLERATGLPAEEWIRLQQEYEHSVAKNRQKEESAANTFVYRIYDEFGQPVKYGTGTDLAKVVMAHQGIGVTRSLDQITDRLPADVAQRKLDKLQRAFANRKQRRRQAAKSSTTARAA